MSKAEPMGSRATLLRGLGTLLALALFALLLSRQGWGEIRASIQRITLGRFLLVLGLATISRLAVTGRWSALLRLSGIRMPLSQILRINYAGLFASNFLPTSVGGDVVRLAWTIKLDSERATYASSIAVDRLVGLAGMAMLLPLGIAQALAGPGVEILGPMWEPLPLALGAAATAWPQRLWSRILRAWRRTAELIVAWLSNPKALLAALGFTWFHMALMFTAMRILFEALGETLSFWQIAGLWSFVYFISLFPVSINSLGLMEVSTGLVYSSIGGAAASSALTVALLMRTASWLASLPGVLSLPGMLALRRSQASSVLASRSEGGTDA